MRDIQKFRGAQSLLKEQQSHELSTGLELCRGAVIDAEDPRTPAPPRARCYKLRSLQDGRGSYLSWEVLNSIDETCLLLAERKYGGSQLDWLLQKDQVSRIEFNGLRVRNKILRVSWWRDLIVLCSNQQRRGLDSRGVLPDIHTKVNPDGLLDRAPVSRCDKAFNDSVDSGFVKCRQEPRT